MGKKKSSKVAKVKVVAKVKAKAPKVKAAPKTPKVKAPKAMAKVVEPKVEAAVAAPEVEAPKVEAPKVEQAVVAANKSGRIWLKDIETGHVTQASALQLKNPKYVVITEKEARAVQEAQHAANTARAADHTMKPATSA